MDKMQIQELISALADGQLQGDDFAHGVELAAGDPQAREAWHTYHLIGDVLRTGELAAGTTSTAFLSRLQLRLQQEDRSVRSVAQAPLGSEMAQAPRHEAVQRMASNDASFKWKLVAGVASFTAMAAIGWTVAGNFNKAEQGQVAAAAAAGPTALAAAERGVMIRDPRLDELLAAHRQLGGATALQMPAGFLRNATFEGPAR